MTESDVKEAEYLIIDNNIYFTMKDINKALEERKKNNDKNYYKEKDNKKENNNKENNKKENKKQENKKQEKKDNKKKEKKDNKYNLLSLILTLKELEINIFKIIKKKLIFYKL